MDCKDAVKSVILVLSAALLLTGCGGAPKKDDVTVAIKKIIPMHFEVLEIKCVDAVPGLFEVVLKVDKQPIVLYVDKNSKYVVSGSIVEVETKQNLTTEAQKRFAQK